MEEKITAWVARDKYNDLCLYFKKPIKTDYFWNSGSEEYYLDNQKLFPQVKWEDEEPTKVELTIKVCKQYNGWTILLRSKNGDKFIKNHRKIRRT